MSYIIVFIIGWVTGLVVYHNNYITKMEFYCRYIKCALKETPEERKARWKIISTYRKHGWEAAERQLVLEMFINGGSAK